MWSSSEFGEYRGKTITAWLLADAHLIVGFQSGALTHWSCSHQGARYHLAATYVEKHDIAALSLSSGSRYLAVQYAKKEGQRQEIAVYRFHTMEKLWSSVNEEETSSSNLLLRGGE